MGVQLRTHHQYQLLNVIQLPSAFTSSLISPSNFGNNGRKPVFSVERPLDFNGYVHTPIQRRRRRRGKRGLLIASSSSSESVVPIWDGWVPDKGSKAPSISDILWPSAGAFAAMAVLGKMDQMLASKGLCMTIAPLGAVSAVLFTAPSSPAARKYNMFMSQIGCAAIGVLALTIFGPGWLARSTGLAGAIAFMIYTRCLHPPAASLPLLFIDGAKLHHLNFWYALFPSAMGCILLCLIQEVVSYLKENFKF